MDTKPSQPAPAFGLSVDDWGRLVLIDAEGVRHVDVETGGGEDRGPEAAPAEAHAATVGPRPPAREPRDPAVDLVTDAGLDRSLHAVHPTAGAATCG